MFLLARNNCDRAVIARRAIAAHCTSCRITNFAIDRFPSWRIHVAFIVTTIVIGARTASLRLTDDKISLMQLIRDADKRDNARRKRYTIARAVRARKTLLRKVHRSRKFGCYRIAGRQ